MSYFFCLQYVNYCQRSIHNGTAPAPSGTLIIIFMLMRGNLIYNVIVWRPASFLCLAVCGPDFFTQFFSQRYLRDRVRREPRSQTDFLLANNDICIAYALLIIIIDTGHCSTTMSIIIIIHP